jgi:signal transduction histidine kinase
MAESLNEHTILSLVNMNLGETYLKLKKLDSAFTFNKEALEYSNSSGFKKYQGLILCNIGNIYAEKGNYDSAKRYLFQSVKINQEHNNLALLAYSYISLANYMVKTGVLDSSLYYGKKGREVYEAVCDPYGVLEAYNSLSEIFKMRSNIDSAYLYQGFAMAMKDSLENLEKIKLFQNIGFDEQLRLRELEEEKIKTQNRIRTYAMLAGIGVFMLIAFLLYRNNRNRKKANDLLQKQKEEIEYQKQNVENTLAELKSTQSQLIQSEKMASLGELTAGIAHEIQNPLNFVNNFSEVNKELIEELKGERSKVKGERNEELEEEIINDIVENEQKINHHGKKADAIVKGMLQHSRISSGIKEPTNINVLADEYLRLAYHGLRAKDKSFNATIKTDFDATIGNINIIPQDIGRVLLNLLTNSFYVVNEKKQMNITGYEPTVTVSTKRIGDKVEVKVSDNGNGIPPKVLDKIFQPFFTTKPTGQGTGLGLSLSYDIIKAHGGEIKVETREGEGTTFIIKLPIGI